MIKKLDGYIAGKYLKTFFFIAFLFSLISVVVNFSEKVDNLIESGQSVKSIIFDFYLNFIPFMNGLLWPIYGLLSVIFFTSKMASNSEIICSFSGGISFYRIMVPYLACAFLLGGMHFYGNHILIPRSNARLIAFENEHIYAGKKYSSAKVNNIHLNLTKDSKIYIGYFDVEKNEGTNFSIEKFDGSKLVYELNARSIKLIEGEEDQWTIKDFVERYISEDGKEQQLKTRQKLDTTLNFTTKNFVHTHNFKETMTSPELYAFVQDLKSKGATSYKKFEIEYHRRSSDAFTIIILTLIGMSIAARKVRGGIGLHLAFGALVGAFFIIFSKFSNSFASSGGDTMLWLGVWFPNIIFSGVTAFLIYKAQK